MGEKQEVMQMLEVLWEQIDWIQSTRKKTVLKDINPDTAKFVLKEAIRIIKEELE